MGNEIRNPIIPDEFLASIGPALRDIPSGDGGKDNVVSWAGQLNAGLVWHFGEDVARLYTGPYTQYVEGVDGVSKAGDRVSGNPLWRYGTRLGVSFGDHIKPRRGQSMTTTLGTLVGYERWAGGRSDDFSPDRLSLGWEVSLTSKNIGLFINPVTLSIRDSNTLTSSSAGLRVALDPLFES